MGFMCDCTAKVLLHAWQTRGEDTLMPNTVHAKQ